MRVRAKRGVCIGVDRHLRPGDTVDVDQATAQFLTSIGAVEHAPDEPPKAVPAPEEPPKAPESQSVKTKEK